MLIYRIKKRVQIGEDQEPAWRQIKSLCMFRTGIKPAWEDDKNQKGSEFRVTLEGETASRLDEY